MNKSGLYEELITPELILTEFGFTEFYKFGRIINDDEGSVIFTDENILIKNITSSDEGFTKYGIYYFIDTKKHIKGNKMAYILTQTPLFTIYLTELANNIVFFYKTSYYMNSYTVAELIFDMDILINKLIKLFELYSDYNEVKEKFDILLKVFTDNYAKQ